MSQPHRLVTDRRNDEGALEKAIELLTRRLRDEQAAVTRSTLQVALGGVMARVVSGTDGVVELF